VVAAIVVWAAYGFRLGTILTPVVETQEVCVDLDQFVRRSQPHPDERLINQPGDILKAPPPLPHNLRLKLLTRISVPAPQYFRGLIQNYMQAKGGHRSFLMGRVSRTGWWYYFIVAFLVKTPIPFLLLIGCALASAAVWREWDEWFILVPCAILVLMAMKAHIDIGIRHLLPIYPLMAIFCGRLGGLFERIRSGKEPRTLPVAVTSLAILVVWFAVDSAVVHPRYLTYFNEIAGGPKGGSRFLVDSNLDWGQDLMRLETALRKHNPPIQSIALAYFGTAEPGAYRIDSIPLDTDPSNVPLNMKPPVAGWVAASVSDLAYFGRPGGSLYWLSHYRPEFIVGNTIRVYHILAPGVKRSDTTRIPPLAPMHWP
jgi:hypothetical protein